MQESMAHFCAMQQLEKFYGFRPFVPILEGVKLSTVVQSGATSFKAERIGTQKKFAFPSVRIENRTQPLFLLRRGSP